MTLTSSCCLLFIDWAAAPGVAKPLRNPWGILLMLQVVPFIALALITWHRLIRHRPWSQLWSSGVLSPRRLAGLVLVTLFMRLMLLNAVAWKYAIPRLHPFAFDSTLANVDHFLHGVDAWRLFAWFTQPRILRQLDEFYEAWFLAFFAMVLGWAWQRESRQRHRFLCAMALIWILGSVIAVVVSSAGPAYYAKVTGMPNRYADLMHALGAAPLATTLQASLWDTYISPAGGIVKGIAAFPSIHVAVPVLYEVSSRRWSVRIIWWCFTALTLVCSIVLAWHYAVDGYAGILLAVGCWVLTGYVWPADCTKKDSTPRASSDDDHT